MNKHIVLAGMLAATIACHQDKKPGSSETVADSSLAKVTPDSSVTVPADTIAVPVTDTAVTYEPAQLAGKWIQPVPGLEKEMQGFHLRKDGSAKSINMYTLVYEKWQLQHDTLLLWSRSEGVKNKDSVSVIDTAIIKSLTDTSLVLFPIRAAEGYLEQYRKKR